MTEILVPLERIRQTILLLRGQRVILDRDLAKLYGVPTKTLKQAVKRNAGRFPEDFMFVLTPAEFAKWRSQFVTSKSDRMGLRHAPMAFTEQGIAMLSSVLNSERAIRVNIAVMRTFVQLRGLLASHEGLARKLEELEKRYDTQFKVEAFSGESDGRRNRTEENRNPDQENPCTYEREGVRHQCSTLPHYVPHYSPSSWYHPAAALPCETHPAVSRLLRAGAVSAHPSTGPPDGSACWTASFSANRVQSVAVAGALWYKHREAKRVPSGTGVPHGG